MARSGEVTRTRLLDAAERLFAEHGVESVSLRDVVAAAGQRNNSAAHYHFGDRAGLVAAVLGRRMEVVNRRRQQLVDALDEGPSGGDSLDALVDAFVTPLTETVVETGGWYARFLARMYGDVFAMRVLADLPEAAPMRQLDLRLRAALEHLDPVLRQSRIDQLMMLVITTLARWEWAGDHGRRRLPPDLLRAEISVTARAVLTAPAAAPVR